MADVDNSKFVAGSGTTTMSILGTIALGTSLLGGGNGNLGGLFGGGNRLAEAGAKIAKLEAERYTDNKVIEAQAREAITNAKLAAMTEKVELLTVKNAADIEALKKETELRAQIDRQQGEINLLKATAPMNAAIGSNTTAIAAIQEVLGKITTVGIPSSAVLPAPTATASAGA